MLWFERIKQLIKNMLAKCLHKFWAVQKKNMLRDMTQGAVIRDIEKQIMKYKMLNRINTKLQIAKYSTESW